ncbi:MAG: glycosyltransferase [Pontiella sp.]
MKTLPPVSIFITTHLDSAERGRVLKTTCENALQLNYPDFEVVVSDNAGAYSAEQALAEITDPRLSIIRNDENLGQTGNTNLCLDRCKHDIIKVNCDDDLLHPDCLMLTVPFVDDETYVITEVGKYIIGTIPPELSEPFPEKLDIEKRPPGYGQDIWEPSHIALPGCCLFSRELFSSLGKYDPDTALPDYDFMLEARLHRNVVFIKNTMCYMGVWDSSITQMMRQSRPYFFITGELYTKFRFLKRKQLGFKNKLGLQFKLCRQFLWESMRVPRHFTQKKYWAGYADYINHLFKYAVKPRADYDFRSDFEG